MLAAHTTRESASSGAGTPLLEHGVDRPVFVAAPLAAGFAAEPPAGFGAGDHLEAGGAAAAKVSPRSDLLLAALTRSARIQLPQRLGARRRGRHGSGGPAKRWRSSVLPSPSGGRRTWWCWR